MAQTATKTYPSLAERYAAHYCERPMAPFPNEYVTRILLGHYPRLNLSKEDFTGLSACDVGFGDGRNFRALHHAGLRLAGTEIHPGITLHVRSQLAKEGLWADLRVGDNACIPFEDQAFDVVLSWNACYYVASYPAHTFSHHVAELARVLKPDGVLIASIPQATNFIYRDAVSLEPGYARIQRDPFSEIRVGEVMAYFETENAIQSAFQDRFYDFSFGALQDDCFGIHHHHHLMVCRRQR